MVTALKSTAAHQMPGAIHRLVTNELLLVNDSGLYLATRNCRLQMLRKRGKLMPPPDKDQDWTHPFYWAPVVLMGNWR